MTNWNKIFQRSLAGPLTVLPPAACIALLGWTASSQAANLTGAFRGNAYATYANAKAGSIAAQLGRSAFQPCPCEGTNGVPISNEIDNLSVGSSGNVLTAATTVSTVLTQQSASTAEVTNSSTITGLNALNGLITADAVEAVADVSATAKTMVGSETGSMFVNLKIAGQPIAANVAPNSVIDLAGIGTVYLNKVTDTGNFKGNGQIEVDMIEINVLQSNSLNLPVGVTIVISHAVAGFSRTEPTDVVGGNAYAVTANDAIGSVLENKIGKAALVTMGCEGTKGKTRTNNITAEAVGTTLTLGTGVTTAVSQSTPTSTTAETTATVQNVGLLGGLVQAATVTAVAEEAISGGSFSASTSGSGFTGLTVLGIPVAITIPPNTGITLPGIGQVIINEQVVPTEPGSPVVVNGLDLKVTLANLLGLPVGSAIIVAHASASVAPF